MFAALPQRGEPEKSTRTAVPAVATATTRSETGVQRLLALSPEVRQTQASQAQSEQYRFSKNCTETQRDALADGCLKIALSPKRSKQQAALRGWLSVQHALLGAPNAPGTDAVDQDPDTLPELFKALDSYYHALVDPRMSNHLRAHIEASLEHHVRDGYLHPMTLEELKRKVADHAKANRLYQPHNIIGSTARADQLPTVYYRSRSGTFGRITQEHANPGNIGREPAVKHPQYRMRNDGPAGNLQEKIGDQTIHRSRNPFVPVADGQKLLELAEAQQAFPYLKRGRYGV